MYVPAYILKVPPGVKLPSGVFRLTRRPGIQILKPKGGPMVKLLVLFIAAGLALAGPKVGVRAGYYGTSNPFTGQDTSGPAIGGQIVLPMALFDLEFSGTYASSKADIVMSDFLVEYVRENGWEGYQGAPEGIIGYLEGQGWSPDTLNSTYEATYHDLGLAGVLKLGVPLGGPVFKPYLGGGFGVHFTASDADVMLLAIERQQGEVTIDPYDHIHPTMLGVAGISIQPPMLPISIFGEYNYSKPIGEEAGDAINFFQAGVNFGF